MDAVDPERLLASAARRLTKLGLTEPALALADSAVVGLRWLNKRSHVAIDLLVGADHYDALKAAEIWGKRLEMDEHGDEYWSESKLEAVFLDVLPPGTSTIELRASIRNDPVTQDWRDPDESGQLRPAPKTTIAELDPTAIPTDSDLLLHLNRLNRLDQEPEEMIGAAKDLVEATAKLVLLKLGEDLTTGSDVAGVSKRALARLNLHPDLIAPTTKGAETMRKILGGLQQIAVGLAELRNMGYGTGHGHGRRVGGLTTRHAELAGRAASAYVAFVLATLNEPNAPWTKTQTAKRLVNAAAAEPARIAAASIEPRPLHFAAGDRVLHAAFGEGTVVVSKLTRNDEEVTVAFPERGVKKLLASLAQLQRL